jgi:hypothetical protein
MTLTRKSIDSRNGVFLKISALFLLAVAAILLNMQSSFASAVYIQRGNISDAFDLGSGIFAAVLFALSLVAYRKLRIEGLLYVSAAFAIFAVRTIVVESSDLFQVQLESSVLELVLTMMIFIALALFFVAVVQRQKIRTKSPQPEI